MNESWSPSEGTTYILPDGTRLTGKTPEKLREAQAAFWKAWGERKSLYKKRPGFTPLPNTLLVDATKTKASKVASKHK